MWTKSILALLLLLLAFNQTTSANDTWQPPRNASEWLTQPVKGAVVDVGIGNEENYDSPPYPTVESFQTLADLGAHVVRIQTPYVWTIEVPYEPIEVEFEYLEGAVNNAIEAGLYVIVSIRNGPGNNSMLGLDEEEVTTALYTDADALDAYQQMLQDLVKRLGDHPEIIAWDPLVEPNMNRYLFDSEPAPFEESAALWHEVATDLVAAIREVDSERPILIAPVNFASADAFPSFIKLDDDNIIYNLHFYDPYPFTHQTDEPFGTYPGTYYEEYVDRDTLESWLEAVDAFQAEYDVPIIVGEWGGIRWVPDMPLYYKDLVSIFEERGWSWLLYAWYDAAWQRSGFEPLWGTNRESLEPDATNVLLEPVLEAWNR